MLRYISKKILYGLLVLFGVVVLVFFLFQGFGDPARLVLGQTGDSATIKNIRKELYLDQPKWKQFAFYLNDVSPLSIHTKQDIDAKKLKGIFIGGETKVGLKVPYLRRSYQSKRDVLEVLADALPGTIILALSAMLLATVLGILLGVLAAVKQNTWWDTSA
ncbi:MAG TPA: ABC transporter permease, partial [Segetibacter sp.]